MKKNIKNKSGKDLYEEISNWDEEDIEGSASVENIDEGSTYTEGKKLSYGSAPIKIDETENDDTEAADDSYILYEQDYPLEAEKSEETENPETDAEDSSYVDEVYAYEFEESYPEDSDETSGEEDEEVEEDSALAEDGQEDSAGEDAEDDTSDDIDDDADDDEDDGEYYEEDDYEDEETYKKRIRHKRRVRNQFISYIVLLLLLGAVGYGVWYGASILIKQITKLQNKNNLESQIEEAMAEEEEEEIVIEAPETDIEEEGETEEEEIVEEIDYVGQRVEMTLSGMTTEEKVAQLFMITPGQLTGTEAPTEAGERTRNALAEYAVGGLIYDKRNITSDDEKLKNLLGNTISMSAYKPFLAIREPGGENSSVYSSDLESVPAVESPAVIGANADSSQAYNAGATVASYLTDYGFNLNLSPDGTILVSEDDINSELCYGSDSALVYDMVSEMTKGLTSGNMDVCLTNFPGNGNITESTADARVESEATAEDIAAQVVSYDCGIAAGAEMVMLNNVTYIVADESGVPASLSKYLIETMLRGNMGFEGVIMTAPLNEKAITEYYTSGQAAVEAIKAGADMIFMPENFEEAYAAVCEAVASGEISASRLDESVSRILRAKFDNDEEE